MRVVATGVAIVAVGVLVGVLTGSTPAGILVRRDVHPVSPNLDQGKPLPHMLDFFGIRVGLASR